MTQKKVLQNIKQKFGCRYHKQLAGLLRTTPDGYIFRMKHEKAGEPAAWLCQVISVLLDEMTEKKIEKVVKKLKRFL